MSQLLSRVDQRTQLAGYNRLELLLFYMDGDQKFGINVFKVNEVMLCPELTKLPQSHPHVIGVTNIRGITIPVIDLAKAIGISTSDDDESRRFIIITECNCTTQAFLVNGMDRIININWDCIEPPPDNVGDTTYLTAITKVGDELVEVIDIERVLAEVLFYEEDLSEGLETHHEDEYGNYHMLVIDDSCVARHQIEKALLDCGVECHFAKNGQEGLDILSEWTLHQPVMLEKLAMIICDIEMPIIDGYTLTTQVREDPVLKNIYILLHSSLSGIFNDSMVKKVGADEFIPKFNPENLANAVIRRLENLRPAPEKIAS